MNSVKEINTENHTHYFFDNQYKKKLDPKKSK